MINAQKLHREFIRLGGMRHKLKNRMLAILPEIYKSGIYKKYAGSIVEYAGKFGDIAKTTVIKRLRLEKNLEDKPCLKAAIEKVGVHKVALVAKIATAETDKTFAENISNMSRLAVQSLSKELRAEEAHFCQAVPRTTRIELDEESIFLLMKLKTKLGKHLSDKEFLKLMLKDRVRQEFPAVAKQSGGLLVGTGGSKSITGDVSRHIPADKKRQIIAQTNEKCSYPNCNSPFQVLHHIDRFSESKSHNSVIPLCKIHHEFAHNNLIQNENMAAEKWQLSIIKPLATQISRADILYKKYKQKLFA
ncbi:hypothetical protein HZA39_03140 [Candidatus Peregrinibacteria bacterium]|nr:hypothetical protein [Candidatus Peregrinibacteria bacterium]